VLERRAGDGKTEGLKERRYKRINPYLFSEAFH
jgi:hypothetical protein